MNKNIAKILEMMHIAEKLKIELRHSWLSDGRQESSAEHSWRLALMVLLLAPETGLDLDLHKALKMAVIHDLVEAEAYDIPAFESHRTEEKNKVEREAAHKYKDLLSSEAGNEIFDLWIEYEERKTLEAKFIKALDNIECRLQHNESDISTWNDLEYPRSLYVADKSCAFNNFLKEFNEQVKGDSRKKILAAGKDLVKIEKKAQNLKKES